MGFNDPTPVSSPRHQPKINKPVAKVREPKCKENKENNSDELVKQVQKVLQKPIYGRNNSHFKQLLLFFNMNSFLVSFDLLLQLLKEEEQKLKEKKTPRPKSGKTPQPHSRAQSRADSARPKSRTWMYG